MKTVSIVVQEQGEMTWYASFEVKDSDLRLIVDPASHGVSVSVFTPNAQDLLTSVSRFTSDLDMAAKLYEVFSGDDEYKLQSPNERENWLKVAKYAASMNAVFQRPRPATGAMTASELRLLGEFDIARFDSASGTEVQACQDDGGIPTLSKKFSREF